MLKKHFSLKHLLPWIGMAILLFSCRESRPAKKPAPVHNIFLVGFGWPDSRNNINNGHGITYYLYLDLKKDSVYVYYPKNINKKEKIARAGRIPNLAQHEAIREFIQSVQWVKTGNTFLDEDSCNMPFYLQYRKDDNQKTYLYNYSTPTPSILKITRLAVALGNDKTGKNKMLSRTTKSLNVDSLMHLIQSQDSLPPPSTLAYCRVWIDSLGFKPGPLSKSDRKKVLKKSKVYQSVYPILSAGISIL